MCDWCRHRALEVFHTGTEVVLFQGGYKGGGHLVLGLRGQQIQATNCQPKLPTVRHLPHTRPQVHQFVAGNLKCMIY